MAVLTIQDIDLDGLVDPTFAAASAGGDQFPNVGDNVTLWIKNAAGAPREITVSAQRACSHGFTHDVIYTLANGSEVLFGDFPAERFTDPATGNVGVTYDSEVGLTVAAVRLSEDATGGVGG